MTTGVIHPCTEPRLRTHEKRGCWCRQGQTEACPKPWPRVASCFFLLPPGRTQFVVWAGEGGQNPLTSKPPSKTPNFSAARRVPGTSSHSGMGRGGGSRSQSCSGPCDAAPCGHLDVFPEQDSRPPAGEGGSRRAVWEWDGRKSCAQPRCWGGRRGLFSDGLVELPQTCHSCCRAALNSKTACVVA